MLSNKLIGHENTYNLILNNFINKSISNSIIFYGNKGVGKATFTYHLISTLFKKLDKNLGNDNDKLIYNDSHPNIKVIRKIYDEKLKKYKTNISIDQIRNIEKFVYQSSLSNLPKFILIDSADDLNNNSANSLLKILEEPTKNTYFFLISHQISLVLPTIRSRCFKFNFLNPNKDIFTEILKNFDDGIEQSELNLLYDLSNNSPGIAIDLYNQNITEIFDFILFFFKQNESLSSELYEFSDRVNKLDNYEFKIYLSLIKFIINNVIKINLGINLNHLHNSYIIKSLHEISNFLDNKQLFNILEYLNYNENSLYSLNLDKKIFNLNIYSSLKRI